MKKVVILGGGTGNFTALRGLRKHPLELSSIVSMADDGGSTGILRDELGVLPPGDVRQCLVALSNSSRIMRSLMNYRFEAGGLDGHSFGNLLLSALEKVTGSFERAVEEVGRILHIKGKVIPVTTHHVRLKMLLHDRKLLDGEKEIYLSDQIDQGYSSLYLEPDAAANPNALAEIEHADVLVLGPGGLFTSIIPNLLVKGVSEAIAKSHAKKVFVLNLMNRKGQTTGYKLSDYLKVLHQYIGDNIDYTLVNNQMPPENLIEKYAKEGDLVEVDVKGDHVILAPLLGELTQVNKNDLIERSLIRHDSDKLAEEIVKIADHL
ncbi:MAG: uridine diphosphate-N-acetylglucosamine-binding protein YvcK [Simkaniaceae bacterium]|nr:uridine diphosphate-N-acetylglucosamine-binding protein YvcK [Simkaniaceae bacterium]